MSENQQKKEKNNKSLSHGSYSILITAIVVIVAVMANLIVNSLPSGMTQFDFSTAKLYTLTDTTKEFLNGLTKDVTLYYICEGGEEDDTVAKLLERYEDASEYVSVEQIDPALYPGFTKQYSEEALDNNSVIAVCGEVHQIVHAESMYAASYSYQTSGYVSSGFDGEGMVTSAIDYVTSEERPVLYALNGNGEGELGSAFTDAVTKNNIEIQSLNLLSAEEIPADAAAILINAPTKDYTEAQADAVIQYLEKGGKALIYSNFSLDEMPNFDSILSNYGVERVDGFIVEGDSNSYITYPYCILPSMYYSEVTADIYENTFILAPMSQGIKATDTFRDSISMQTLLATSVASYSKVDAQNMTTAEKEEGDIDGPFNVGMLMQEDIDNNDTVDTEVIYFSSGYLLDEDYNQNVSGGNAQLFANAVSYLCAGEDTSSAVPMKSLQVPYLTMSSFTANFWTIICVFVLPLAFILVGAVKWLKRRKG